jgi:5-methylcytosine-specific restriction endonuclease McrA
MAGKRAVRAASDLPGIARRKRRSAMRISASGAELIRSAYVRTGKRRRTSRMTTSLSGERRSAMMTDAPQGTKCCTKCGETQPLDAFGKNSGSRDGLRSACKGCTNAGNHARKAADPVKYRELGRRSAAKRRREEPAMFRERARRDDRNYLERMRTERPDDYRERWERDSARRRATKARVAHAPYSRSEIFARWGGVCAYCDAPAEHLDHVIALSLGGADAAHNLLPACAPCNLGKGAKTLAEWAATFGA